MKPDDFAQIELTKNGLLMFSIKKLTISHVRAHTIEAGWCLCTAKIAQVTIEGIGLFQIDFDIFLCFRMFL